MTTMRAFLDATRLERQSIIHHFVAAFTRAITSLSELAPPDLAAITAQFFQSLQDILQTLPLKASTSLHPTLGSFLPPP